MWTINCSSFRGRCQTGVDKVATRITLYLTCTYLHQSTWHDSSCSPKWIIGSRRPRLVYPVGNLRVNTALKRLDKILTSLAGLCWQIVVREFLRCVYVAGCHVQSDMCSPSEYLFGFISLWAGFRFASRHLCVNIICQSDAVTRLTFTKDILYTDSFSLRSAKTFTYYFILKAVKFSNV